MGAITKWLRACLHRGGGPQTSEVTYGGSPNPSCKHNQIKMRDYMDRRVTHQSGLPHQPGVPHLNVNRTLIQKIEKTLNNIHVHHSTKANHQWLSQQQEANQKWGEIVSLAAIVTERCVTSKKRLRGRLQVRKNADTSNNTPKRRKVLFDLLYLRLIALHCLRRFILGDPQSVG